MAIDGRGSGVSRAVASAVHEFHGLRGVPLPGPPAGQSISRSAPNPASASFWYPCRSHEDLRTRFRHIATLQQGQRVHLIRPVPSWLKTLLP
jgi:hypothetical protein